MRLAADTGTEMSSAVAAGAAGGGSDWGVNREGAANSALASLDGTHSRALLHARLVRLFHQFPLLRTSLESRKGDLLPVVRDDVIVRLPVDDLTHLAGPERDRALSEWCSSQIRRRFDLAAPPLARFGLARVAPQRYLLSVVTHPWLAERGALGVIDREWCAPLGIALRSGDRLPAVETSGG